LIFLKFCSKLSVLYFFSAFFRKNTEFFRLILCFPHSFYRKQPKYLFLARFVIFQHLAGFLNFLYFLWKPSTVCIIRETNLYVMRNFLSNVYTTEWLNLVFENRNKSYGAYVLRTESSKNMLRAFFIAAPMFVLSFVLPQMLSRQKQNIEPQNTDKVVDIVQLQPLKAKPLPPQPQPAPAAAPAEKLKTVKIPSHIKVVDMPVSEDEMPTLSELKHAVVGSQNQTGIHADAGAVAPPATTVGTSVSDMPGADDSIHETTALDAYPEFEGGMKAWARYLQRSLRYPQQAQEEGLQGKVFISFVIEKDGSISNVTVLRGVASSLDQEAARVIQKSPKWKPGSQNNQRVRVRFNMPITFSLAD